MDVTRAVLVTGASTGIGRRVTELLAANSFFVYAGARSDRDLISLNALENVQALRLDVTNESEISAAIAVVAGGGRGLYALVNNAGVATCGSAVGGNQKELELTLAINAGGPFRITAAFGPMIIAQHGRVVMIGSTSGILAGPQMSAYCMSKHAVEALADCLAAELEPTGVRVSVVEPGRFNTALVRNALERGADRALPDLSQFPLPDDVAAAVYRALSEPRPKRRYLVVSDQDEARRTIYKQIEQLVQLNEDHPFSYDREGLLKMLDEALLKMRPQDPSVTGRTASHTKDRLDA
jgi:NAD(P)-dependent dehydrogenase (short-subunit alcohol dehydrogenase family)